MPVYEYKAVSQAGKAVRGVVDADNPKALKELLRKQGVYLSEFRETGASGEGGGPGDEGGGAGRRRWFSGRVKTLELAEATRQISTLIRAAIPVVDALTAVSKQTENPRLHLVLSEVRRSVSEGKSLAGAMAEHPAVFPDLYTNMVKAGESSGTLDLVFRRLADFTEAQARLKAKLLGTMMYPLIMLIVGTGIVSMLMIFVVPKMTVMFQEMGHSLPLVTRILIAISDYLQSWWHVTFGGMVLLGFWFNRYRKGDKGRKRWDGLMLRLPLFGPLVRMVALARFSRTLGTLLSSGVPIITALEIVKHVVDNRLLADVIEDAKLAVKEGENLAKPLQRSGQFPPMMVHMISIGEQSGELEEMLDNVAASYEVQVDSKITMLTSLLEPLLILSMGGVVAFIVFAILTPMLQMNELLKG